MYDVTDLTGLPTTHPQDNHKSGTSKAFKLQHLLCLRVYQNNGCKKVITRVKKNRLRCSVPVSELVAIRKRPCDATGAGTFRFDGCELLAVKTSLL